MPTRPAVSLATAGLLAAAAAAPTAAQPVPPAPAGATPVRTAAIANVPAGAPVRVVVNGRRVAGAFQRVAFDTLLVRVGGGETFRAPVARVDTLWARTGRGTARGAKIGAAVGGVALGTVAGLLAYGLCETPGGCNDTPGIAVLGAVVGGAGGGLLGAGIGSVVRTWRRVSP